jgi:hypothetical protein
MNSSELVTPQHLARKAIIYIRQSSPHAAISNQESLRLQYALEQRALGLGWRPEDIEIIDADLGLTGAMSRGLQRCRLSGHPGPGRHHPLLRSDAALTQLLRLVSLARCLWLQELSDCRRRRYL